MSTPLPPRPRAFIAALCGLFALSAPARGGEDATLWLDAGPFSSPVMPGFARLDAAGSEDPRATWRQPPRQAVAGAFPDPLAGDALAGGTLHLALPAGRWRLWVMLGQEPLPIRAALDAFGLKSGAAELLRVEPPQDFASWIGSPFAALNPWPRFNAGETAWDRQIALRHPWHTVEVDVGPDGLLISPFGRALQALVAAPAGSSAPDLTSVAAQRRSFFHRYWQPGLDGAPAPSAGAGITRAAWDQAPAPNAASPVTSWSPTLARGDRQGTVLWVAPADGPIRVEVDGLAGLEVETWEVGWIDAAQGLGRPVGARPGLVRPMHGELLASQGAPAGLGLVLRVPVNTKAGLHTGAVRFLNPRGDLLGVADVRAEVLDATLPPAPVPSGFIMLVHAAATALDGHAAPSVQARVDDDLARMRLLGCDALTFKGTLVGTRFPNDDPAPAAAFARSVIQRWADAGGRVVQWSDPKMHLREAGFVQHAEDPLPDALVPPLIGLLEAIRGAPLNVVLALWEEEGGWKDVDAINTARALVPQIRALSPGVRLGAAAAHPLDWQVAGLIDVVAVSNLPALRRSTVAQVREAGGEPWAYNLAPGRSGPLAAWAGGVDAFMQWHWSPSPVDVFYDLHPTPVWWYAAVGPDNRTWHTALAEQFALGIADTRYLSLLEARAGAAVRARSPKLRERGARALELITALRSALDGPVGSAAWEGEVLTPESMDRAREAVVAAIGGLPEPAR